MAMSFATGDLTWLAADAVSTTYTVSGLGFQPKALFFIINGLPNFTSSISTNARFCYGFATSTSDRRCVGLQSVDAAASADTQEIYRADAVLATVNTAGAVDGRLDLNSITSGGFTLIVDDTAPVDLLVIWYAWGGTDIITAATGEIAEPAGTGNQSYSVTGWQSTPTGATQCGVLFAGCQLTGAAPTAAVADAGMMLGAASGTGSGNQWIQITNEDEGSASSDCDEYFVSSECIGMITSGGGNPNARGQFNGFDSAGFDINWTNRATTGRKYIYLAMQGGYWKAGTFSLVPTPVGNTATISGLSSQPVGAIHTSSRYTTEATPGTSNAGSYTMVGGWASTSSRRAVGYSSDNSAPDMVIGLVADNARIIDSNFGYQFDIDSITSDGFVVIVDVATTLTTNTTNGFLAFGNSAPAILPPTNLVVLDAVRRSFSW